MGRSKINRTVCCNCKCEAATEWWSPRNNRLNPKWTLGYCRRCWERLVRETVYREETIIEKSNSIVTMF